MLKSVFYFLFSFVLLQTAGAQKYFSRNAVIRIHSNSKAEKIEGVNSTATTVMELTTGKVEFAALINAFVFEKALMQEHFNENYMESTKFPKAVFKGSFPDPQSLKLSTPGNYKTTVNGELTMHGVTRPLSAPVEFVVDDKGIHGSCTLMVKCSDFDITIPSVVKNTVSNDVEIKVRADYKAL